MGGISDDYMVHPTPRAATMREQATLGRLHNLGCRDPDPGRRSTILDACRLIIDFIEERRRPEAFGEHNDRPHEDD